MVWSVLFLANAVFLFVIPDPMLATKLRGLVGLIVRDASVLQN